MSSPRRIAASRANGTRSHGPKTPEGKSRASSNALRHGLLAKCVVVGGESREGFENLLTQYTERFGPLDPVELALVEEMVSSNWRLRRGWAIEAKLFNDAIERQPEGDELSRLAAAFKELAATPELALLHRYETRLHRISQRALDNLCLLRMEPTLQPAAPVPDEPDANDLPNEPNPIPEQPEVKLVNNFAARPPVPGAHFIPPNGSSQAARDGKPQLGQRNPDKPPGERC